MARIRSMKPEMRNSLTVASWPRDARLLFAYMWGYLDDHGRGVDDIRLIKADTFPLDDDITPADIDLWLNIMAGTGTMCRYSSGGRRYIHAVNWSEHQRPSHPGPSRIPPCTRSHDPEDPPEDFARDSGGTPRGSGGGPIGPPVDRANGTTYVGRAVGALTEETLVMTLVKSSGVSPESLVPEQGAGSREQGVKPTAPTALPAVADGATATQRSKAITDAYYAVEPMSKWPAVNAIVLKAIKTGRWTDEQIHDAMQRLAADRRGVTVDTLRHELTGPPMSRASPPTLVVRNGMRLKPETVAHMDDDQRWAAADAASANQPRLAIGGTA